MSLPQGEDRTPEEKTRFKNALDGINAWYASICTYVLLVTTPLPTGWPEDYINKKAYKSRGW